MQRYSTYLSKSHLFGQLRVSCSGGKKGEKKKNSTGSWNHRQIGIRPPTVLQAANTRLHNPSHDSAIETLWNVIFTLTSRGCGLATEWGGCSALKLSVCGTKMLSTFGLFGAVFSCWLFTEIRLHNCFFGSCWFHIINRKITHHVLKLCLLLLPVQPWEQLGKITQKKKKKVVVRVH